MKRQGLIQALTSLVIVSIVVIGVVSFTIYGTKLVGPIIILSGADIIFGTIDTEILAIAALVGANFAGVLGAIVGGSVGDSITDGFAGLFEGRMAEYLRKLGIEESRTPLSSSMGKMSGCLIGVGIVLTFTWSILRISIEPR